MRVFKDAKGREWEVALTVGSIRRVRDNLKVDLLDPMEGTPPLATRLFLDMVLLGEVMYWVCYPQMQSRGVDPDSFGDAMGGAEGKAAYEAFFEELMDFFRLRGRPEIVRTIAANLELVRKGLAAADMLIKTRLETNLDGDNTSDRTGRTGDGRDGGDASRWEWSDIDDLAGIVGVDPGPITLRSLAAMARSKEKTEWERTAWLLAKIHNCHCTDARSPNQCNPFMMKPPSTDMMILKPLLANPEA
jgi:hypothetical protein